MKQFDLNTYLRLKEEGMEPKIVTMDSRSARILCTDRKGHYPIVAAILESDGSEGIRLYTEEGCAQDTISTSHDLFFADLDPEPTYRPYKDADECFKSLKEHDMIVRHNSGDYHLVVTINDSHIWLGNAQVDFSHKQLLNEFTFIDGSRCGVKEGE